MMKVMTSFKLDRNIISLGHRETISFYKFGEKYMMSYIDFFVRMGLINVEYTNTKSYSQLHINQLVHLSTDQVWT